MHVPGSDLENVGILGHQLRLLGSHNSATTPNPVSALVSARVGVLLLKTLERIGEDKPKAPPRKKWAPVS